MLLVIALVFASSCRQYVWVPVPDWNQDQDQTVPGGGEEPKPEEPTVESIDNPDNVFIAGGTGTFTATVEYSDGSSKTVEIPSEVIEEATAGLEAGIHDVAVTIDGVEFRVRVYVPAAEGETDANVFLIDDGTDFLNFMTGNATVTQKTAILTTNVDLNITTTTYYTNSDTTIYSTSPDNTVTITGVADDQAQLFIKGNNITLNGFRIVSGDNPEKNILKISGLTASTYAENVVLENMYFSAQQRGLNFDMTRGCKLINCTITSVSSFNGELQIRHTFPADGDTADGAGLLVENLTIEGEPGTIYFNQTSDDVAAGTGCKGVLFRNLTNVESIAFDPDQLFSKFQISDVSSVEDDNEEFIEENPDNVILSSHWKNNSL